MQDMWATGDKQRIKQVLNNLLDNALKFTPQGQIFLRIFLQDEQLRFEVQDTGIGIAPEKQSQIFQRFEHSTVETNRQFGGSGLGLAIAERLVKRMGGHIGVQSKGQQGSTFWFSLPLPVEHIEKSEPVAQKTTHWSKEALRFLLVDDNAVNRKLAAALLKRRGIHVHEVDGGVAALSILGQEPFDAVLL